MTLTIILRIASIVSRIVKLICIISYDSCLLRRDNPVETVSFLAGVPQEREGALSIRLIFGLCGV